MTYKIFNLFLKSLFIYELGCASPYNDFEKSQKFYVPVPNHLNSIKFSRKVTHTYIESIFNSLTTTQ